ncbi:putative NSF attachment protein [Helianthus annuus]|uniref:Putative NSF attachment protein n=1 Tax=Helianthus annuus TaxID=4232 RepID=A0A251UXY9_HELAN|nr:putative NSF attachment protein [Helianthus annuus]KAJ0628597.1 putative NSF attachment protein [Helianthus annuus]KAJ0784926.1 putative NSF attachment protein [Helianthus annuus]
MQRRWFRSTISLLVTKGFVGYDLVITATGQYQKAIEIYEEIARPSLNNNLLKYGIRGHLLNAGICQLCKGDVVAITNALERYQELDPTFSGTREYKLLTELAAAMDEEDVAKFTDAVKEFDSMTKLRTIREPFGGKCIHLTQKKTPARKPKPKPHIDLS